MRLTAITLALPLLVATPGLAAPLQTDLALDDRAALQGLLTGLIEQEEGVQANVPNAPEDQDLQVLFDWHEPPCQLDAATAKLVCDVVYVRGRWNGELRVELAVTGDRATAVTKTDFAGNF